MLANAGVAHVQCSGVSEVCPGDGVGSVRPLAGACSCEDLARARGLGSLCCYCTALRKAGSRSRVEPLDMYVTNTAYSTPNGPTYGRGGRQRQRQRPTCAKSRGPANKGDGWPLQQSSDTPLVEPLCSSWRAFVSYAPAEPVLLLSASQHV